MSKKEGVVLYCVRVIFIICYCLAFSINISYAENKQNIKNEIQNNYNKNLTLEKFLNEVKDKNGNFKNYQEQMNSDKQKTQEKKLLTSPTFFASTDYSKNYKKSTISDVDYNHKSDLDYNIGISQNTDFGLNGKIYYDLSKTAYTNSDPTIENKALGSIKIELEQNLLKNSFGENIKANKLVIENQNMINYYNNRYGSKQLIQNAENTYWALIITKKVTEVKMESVKQMQEMHNYTVKKVKMNLMDKSNEFQSKAALELSKLDLQTSEDNEKDIVRLFNSLRGIDSDTLEEKLENIPWEVLENYKILEEYKTTAQLKALEKQVNTIKANSIIDRNKYRPSLDLVASYSSNSEEDQMHKSLNNIDDTSTPTGSVGIKFSAPLNFSAVKDFKSSSYKDENAIKLKYKQQVLSDRVAWNQLLDKMKYAQSRLKLARKIESIQEEKLKNEIKRWKNGISTTYQVVQFENELTQSKLSSLSIANNIVNIMSNLKLFEIENNN